MNNLFDFMEEKGIEVAKAEVVETKTPTKTNKEKNKPEKKEVEPEKYLLPLNIYYAGNNHEIAKEEYPDKDFLMKEELLIHFQTNFGYRVLTEKRTGIEYDKDNNELVIHLLNPSKGSVFQTGLTRILMKDGAYRFVKSDNYGYIVGPIDSLVDEKGSILVSTGLYLDKKIPCDFLHEILEVFTANYPNEIMCQIFFDRNTDDFILHWPEQTTTSFHIQREKESFFLNSRDVILFSEIHSHGACATYFSKEDDENEVDFLIYGVIGEVKTNPVLKLRLGFNGVFHTIDNISDVFDANQEVLI